MPRDDFTEATIRTLAQRAGGRCSFPGCDILCWIPGQGPDRTATIGVAAHICAASPGGKRYDPSQTSEQRKDIRNAIYLCQNHAHLIDTDEITYTTQVILDWKNRHENQIRGEASGEWLFPEISITKGLGLSVRADQPHFITEDTIGNYIEHTLLIKNVSDYEYRRIGFSVQYPEFILDPPIITGPPGFAHTLQCENMDWEVLVEGGGSVSSPKISHYGSFTLEGNSILQGQTLKILMRSTPDPIKHNEFENKILFSICGEVAVNLGSMLVSQGFAVPLFINFDDRKISNGFIHASDPESDQYVTLTRCY